MKNISRKKVFLSLGSNMGNREENLSKAISMLENKDNKVLAMSKVYVTGAWGLTDQPDFLNQAVLMETCLNPRQLLDFLLGIEKNMGRERKQKYGPRNIDLDIIFFDNLVVHEQGLHIPHPLMHKRNFVLVPVMEIDPEFVHPELGKTMAELVGESNDPLPVVPYREKHP
jgi:2-amino-4-hydroxy-6-hydroxymethyldihydropteridine diphosphokinase